MGWPANVRTISVSNAICNSNLVFPDNSQLFSFTGQRASTYFGQLWRSLAATLAGIFSNIGTSFEFPLSFVSTRTSLNVDIWANSVAPNFQNTQLYNGDVFIKRKILLLINVNTYLTKSKGYSGSSSYAIDNSPAGVYDLERFGFDQAAIQANLPNFVNLVVQPRFSFVPKPSSLNITNPYSNFRTDICNRKLVCENNTSFRGYFVSSNSNEVHISYNRANAEYIFGQMQGDLDCSSVCPILNGITTLCTTSTYTVTGLPANASVTWSALPSYLVSINPIGNGQSANISLANSGNTILTATAGCNSSVTKNIRVGAYTTSEYYIISSSPPFCKNQTVQFGLGWWMVPDANYYNWVWSGANYVSGQGTRVLTLQMPTTVYGYNPSVSVGLSVGNACGNSSFLPFSVFSINPNCYSNSPFRVSPNPSSDNLRIEPAIDTETGAALTQPSDIIEIELIDKMGLVKLKRKIGKGIKTTTINVAILPNDVYTMRIFDGQTWHSHKIIIQH